MELRHRDQNKEVDKLVVELAKTTDERNKLLKAKKYQRGQKRKNIEEKIFQTHKRDTEIRQKLEAFGVRGLPSHLIIRDKSLLQFDIFGQGKKKLEKLV
jgi:uncharacterized protein YhaN